MQQRRLRPISNLAALQALVLVLAVFRPAMAHKPSDSYLRMTIPAGAESPITAEWDISLRDLELLVGLDIDQNGSITWGEVLQRRPAIVAHALSRLAITSGKSEGQLEVQALLINDHSDGKYVTLQMATGRSTGDGPVSVHYDLMFDSDPTHRGLLMLTQAGRTTAHVLTPTRRSFDASPASTNHLAILRDYVAEGVWHIWIGFDHILFLIALMLPTTFQCVDGKWVAMDDFWPVCHRAFALVTVFTVAHSVTLWMAVMQFVSLPSQWVEVTIALSIVVTCAHNLYPVLKLPARWVAFGFGLIHGFGFAGVLTDLGLTETALAVPLLGFNLGVELGQASILLCFLPVAYAMRGSQFYRVVMLRAGSVVLACIACIWMYERIFDNQIIGF